MASAHRPGERSFMQKQSPAGGTLSIHDIHSYVGIIQIRLWVEAVQLPLSRLAASSP